MRGIICHDFATLLNFGTVASVWYILFSNLYVCMCIETTNLYEYTVQYIVKLNAKCRLLLPSCVSIIYTYTLENIEGTIIIGQSSIGYTRRRKTKQKHNTICVRHHFSFLCEMVTDIPTCNSECSTYNRTSQHVTQNVVHIIGQHNM